MKGSREKLKAFSNEAIQEDNWLSYLKKNYAKMTKEQRLEYLMKDNSENGYKK